MNQQEHLIQLVDQKNRLLGELETYNTEGAKTRELLLKTQGAIEYLQAVGVTLPEPEVTEEAEETPAEEG